MSEESRVEKAVPPTELVMIAWQKYKAAGDYENTKKWAAISEHTEGSLWAAFYSGFFACASNEAPKAAETYIAGLREARAIVEDVSVPLKAPAYVDKLFGKLSEAILARIAELEKKS